MAIVKFEPFRGFEGIARKMNDFLQGFDRSVFDVEFGNFVPRVDVNEDEKNLYIQAEVPGIPKEEIKVSINDENVLTIRGEKKQEEKREDKTHIRIERNYGSFTRSFVLPDYIKKDTVNTKFENGVLSIQFEKTEPVKPKEVEIKVS